MRDPLKNVSQEFLESQRDRFDYMRRHLGWIYAESDRLSDVAQHELSCARLSVRLQLELIDAELAVRAQMLPTQIAS